MKIKDMRTDISRRKLLSGLGALTAALSSPIWRSSTAFGADAKTPGAKRFIGVFSSVGTIQNDFFPNMPGVPDAPIKLQEILKPLQKHAQQMMILKGVHMFSTIYDKLGVDGAARPGGPHMKGPGAMLTGGSLGPGVFTGSGGPAGWADRISVDQFIANRWAGQSKFPSLEFGVRVEGQEPLRVISYRGDQQPNLTNDDPWSMYQRLFADANLSKEELAKQLAERKSVLDFLKGEITALKGRLSADDRARLDAHLTGIRALEDQLSKSGVQCQPITLPAEKLDPRKRENYDKVGRLQTDLMILAHSCGLTRVSTFMWANANSWQTYPWLGINDEHHELSHASDDDMAAREKLIKINAWHAEQIAYVLDRLAAIPEADGGNMLDNTLLLWGNELGAGNSHTYRDIPWMIAGGTGGYFRMGRYLQYKDQPHNNMLVSICNAMGFEDVKTFGMPGVCTGPLEKLRG